jgi:hypothetical protein
MQLRKNITHRAITPGGSINIDSLRRFVIATTVLNLVWEFAHMPLYTLWDNGTWAEIIFAAVHCTGADLLIAMCALIVSLLLFGESWPSLSRASTKIALLTVVIGVLYTIFSEWLNIVVRQSWEYADSMPIVPIINTGVSPLLQWLVVPSLALWWAWRPSTNQP